ncbi:MAG: TonB-dependent receptor plug domain-containing protein [Bacteroidetes bacterium]|nr:TonB-dependent receptor plug domain-containing protein [Bacteroidota bacterium]
MKSQAILKHRLRWMIPLHLIVVSISVGQEVDDDEVINLSPFTVTTDTDIAYTAQRNISATRTNIATADLPQSVVVFNQELLEDLDLISLTNVLDLDPSYLNGFSSEDGVGQIVGRGLAGTSLLFVDGFTTLGSNSIIPIVGVERIEILKGPNAVLYGETSPSGVINRVTKRAIHDQTFGSFRVSVGQTKTNDDYSTSYSVDYNTPLDLKFVPEGWGEFALRVEVQGQDKATVKDNTPAEATSIYPTLGWKISENTSLDVYGWYTQTAADVQWESPISVANGGIGSDGFATGTPIYGFFKPDGSFAPIGNGEDVRGLRYTAAGKLLGDDDARETENFVYAYDFQHRFNETVSFRSQMKNETFFIDRLENLVLAGQDWPINRDPVTGNLVIGYTDPETNDFLLGERPGVLFGQRDKGVSITAEDWLTPRRTRYLNEDQTRFDIRNEVLIQAQTGSFNHNFLIGQTFEKFRSSRERVEVRNPSSFPNPEDVANYPQADKWEFVSVLDPKGGGILNFPANSNPVSITGGATVPRADFISIQPNLADREVTSYYFNDMISAFEERLFINVGYRRQTNKNNLNGRSADGDPITLGALYHLNDDHNFSVYANANETFTPEFAISDDGFDLPARTGEQFEVGLKFDLGRSRSKPGFFTGSLAYYNLELKNVPINIADDPNTDTILRPLGEGRTSEGLEFTFTSAPVDGLKLFGGLAYVIDADDPALTGLEGEGFLFSDLHVQNVSDFTANVLARYQFQEGNMRGSFVSFGLRHNSKRNPELRNGGLANNFNTLYIVPSNTTMNFGLGKTFQAKRSEWTVSLFVDNITDELNIGRALPDKISFDSGRTWRLQVRNRF